MTAKVSEIGGDIAMSLTEVDEISGDLMMCPLKLMILKGMS